MTCYLHLMVKLTLFELENLERIEANDCKITDLPLKVHKAIKLKIIVKIVSGKAILKNFKNPFLKADA